MKSNFIECATSVRVACGAVHEREKRKVCTLEEEHAYANKIMNADDATDVSIKRVL